MASRAGRNGAARIASTTGVGMPTIRCWKYSTASPRLPADERVERGGMPGWTRGRLDGEGQVEQREVADGEAVRGGGEREGGARREADHGRRAARALDQAIEVLDLALDGVRGAVAAVPAPAAVVVEDGVARGQRGCERSAGVARVEGTENDDDGRSVTRAIEGDVGRHA